MGGVLWFNVGVHSWAIFVFIVYIIVPAGGCVLRRVLLSPRGLGLREVAKVARIRAW